MASIYKLLLFWCGSTYKMFTVLIVVVWMGSCGFKTLLICGFGTSFRPTNKFLVTVQKEFLYAGYGLVVCPLVRFWMNS